MRFYDLNSKQIGRYPKHRWRSPHSPQRYAPTSPTRHQQANKPTSQQANNDTTSLRTTPSQYTHIICAHFHYRYKQDPKDCWFSIRPRRESELYWEHFFSLEPCAVVHPYVTQLVLYMDHFNGIILEQSKLAHILRRQADLHEAVLVVHVLGSN